jgi:hypothetical protein
MDSGKIALFLAGLLSLPVVANATEHASNIGTIHCFDMSAEAARELRGNENVDFQSEAVEVCFDHIGNIFSIVDIISVDGASQPNF